MINEKRSADRDFWPTWIVATTIGITLTWVFWYTFPSRGRRQELNTTFYYFLTGISAICFFHWICKWEYLTYAILGAFFSSLITSLFTMIFFGSNIVHFISALLVGNIAATISLLLPIGFRPRNTEGSLVNTDLSEADMRMAKMDGANLKGANISNTNLTDTSMKRVFLAGANLKGARTSKWLLDGV